MHTVLTICEFAAWLVLCGVLAFLARKVFTMSAATDRLTASTAALGASVDALIARIPPPAPPVDETPVIAAANAIDALTAKVNSTDPATVVAPPIA